MNIPSATDRTRSIFDRMARVSRVCRERPDRYADEVDAVYQDAFDVLLKPTSAHVEVTGEEGQALCDVLDAWRRGCLAGEEVGLLVCQAQARHTALKTTVAIARMRGDLPPEPPKRTFDEEVAAAAAALRATRPAPVFDPLRGIDSGAFQDRIAAAAARDLERMGVTGARLALDKPPEGVREVLVSVVDGTVRVDGQAVEVSQGKGRTSPLTASSDLGKWLVTLAAGASGPISDPQRKKLDVALAGLRLRVEVRHDGVVLVDRGANRPVRTRHATSPNPA